ncbi:HTH protein [Pontimonas phage phiPsal1]|nr:HTH protein [Pontimonas phage phiPsal1]
MLPIKPEDITVDKLDEVSREWDQNRIYAVTRGEVVIKGDQYRAAVARASELEIQCMLRARRLCMWGITRKEIGELFGVDQRTVNKWLKGMD